MRRCRIILILLLTIPVSSIWAATVNRDDSLSLKSFNNGIFSLTIPKGWKITTAGDGSTLAFLTYDPLKPYRQIFYFGMVGPIYLSYQQKQIDLNYMRNGGYPIAWIEMPVIQPFTPGNFLSHFNEIAQTNIAQNFMPDCPRLEKFTIISSQPQRSLLPGGSTQLVRALFQQNGQLAEGLFMATTIPYMQFMNGPGGGNGYGCMIMGVTALKKEFRNLQVDLIRSLGSFTVSPAYARNYIQRQQGVFAEVIKAGQTLREASDIIIKGWKNRSKTADILAEKRSDAILGTERLYDPGTGEIYEFDMGFYDKYNLNRNRYEMNNLELLPDKNYKLWMQAPLNGRKHLK